MKQPDFIGIWRDWYAEQLGVGPKTIMINGKHGKAAKELIAHLKEAHPKECPGEVLKVILNNWDRLPDVYREQCRELHSIKNNWNSLIHHIKNGNGDNQDQISAYLRSL